jgi:hypothetical protein
MSDDADLVDDPYLATAAMKPAPTASGLNGFFKALRGKNVNKFLDSHPREAGMEQNLINKIEKMHFKDQMEMFYTAYSKVCL